MTAEKVMIAVTGYKEERTSIGVYFVPSGYVFSWFDGEGQRVTVKNSMQN